MAHRWLRELREQLGHIHTFPLPMAVLALAASSASLRVDDNFKILDLPREAADWLAELQREVFSGAGPLQDLLVFVGAHRMDMSRTEACFSSHVLLLRILADPVALRVLQAGADDLETADSAASSAATQTDSEERGDSPTLWPEGVDDFRAQFELLAAEEAERLAAAEERDWAELLPERTITILKIPKSTNARSQAVWRCVVGADGSMRGASLLAPHAVADEFAQDLGKRSLFAEKLRRYIRGTHSARARALEGPTLVDVMHISGRDEFWTIGLLEATASDLASAPADLDVGIADGRCRTVFQSLFSRDLCSRASS